MADSKKLLRSNKDKIIFGVCGGLGEYFDIDPTIVRIIFVLLTLFGGSGILIYLILALVMPTDDNPAPIEKVKEVVKNEMEEEKKEAQSEEKPNKNRRGDSYEGRLAFGVILLIAGVIFLFGNIGLPHFQIEKLWPVFLIAVGLLILSRKV